MARSKQGIPASGCNMVQEPHKALKREGQSRRDFKHAMRSK
jgi:hypothetical protein